jgi:hypothetical protein
MSTDRVALFVGVVLLLSAVTANAHHSFAATYDLNKSLTIEGKVIQFLFRNPHSFVQIEVRDDAGAVRTWSVEWGGAGQLGEQGVTRDTLKIGDNLSVSGNPGRDAGEHRLRMTSLRRTSDGFGWGTRPGQVVD